jgi:GDP-mannose 6-dehydrogenase
MRISVFGLGYVGAVSCGCLAKLGHQIIGVDVSPAKVGMMAAGQPPVIEDGLDELLREAVGSGRLRATTSVAEAVSESDVALVCVGTPSAPSGRINSQQLELVCHQIGQAVAAEKPAAFSILNRSTSLPPVHEKLMAILEATTGRRIGDGLSYICHPEFLREGVAIEDFFHPPKIVFGCADLPAQEICRRLYPTIDAPVFFVAPGVASMIKYADNCFHAVKATFGNEIGMMCRRFQLDSHQVMEIFCADTKLNISAKYLKPGMAFGGSCLPKDLRAILDAAREEAAPLPMLSGAMQSNQAQIEQLLQRILSPSRPRVGIIGLAFKEGTDDVRESPMVHVVEQLCGKGHPVRIYDEHLAVAQLVGSNLNFALGSIPHLTELLSDDLNQVVGGSDLVVVGHRLTEEKWRQVTWAGQRVIDTVRVPALESLPNYEGLYW